MHAENLRQVCLPVRLVRRLRCLIGGVEFSEKDAAGSGPAGLVLTSLVANGRCDRSPDNKTGPLLA